MMFYVLMTSPLPTSDTSCRRKCCDSLKKTLHENGNTDQQRRGRPAKTETDQQRQQRTASTKFDQASPLPLYRY